MAKRESVQKKVTAYSTTWVQLTYDVEVGDAKEIEGITFCCWCFR